MKNPISYEDFQRLVDRAEYIEIGGYLVETLIVEPGKSGLGYICCDEFNNCAVAYCQPNDEYYTEYGRLFVKHTDGKVMEIKLLVTMRL